MRHSLAGTLLRLTAVAVLAAAVGLGGLWGLDRSHLLSGNTTNGSTKTPTLVTGAAAVTPHSLTVLSQAQRRPIYWAGTESSVTYELTQTSTGRAYVRYLPPGVAVGSPDPYLTIGTYPMVNAYAVTVALARQPGTVRIPVRSGEVAFYRQHTPTNVYVAFAGTNAQIEVFDPSPAHAQELVAGGSVAAVTPIADAAPVLTTPVLTTPVPTTPVPTTSASTTPVATTPAGAPAATAAAVAAEPTAASPTQLDAAAASLGHPIYWLGAQTGTTYELTRSLDGRVYIRYLPHGAAVGTPDPYLTVATYPLVGAYSETRNAAHARGNVTVAVHGGIAFYSQTHPTSVYVAYPGVNDQIEVFDPTASVARQLVAAARVQSVP